MAAVNPTGIVFPIHALSNDFPQSGKLLSARRACPFVLAPFLQAAHPSLLAFWAFDVKSPSTSG